jgi:hypothetical protein
MAEQRCENCRFWERFTYEFDGQTGDCVRYPPQIKLGLWQDIDLDEGEDPPTQQGTLWNASQYPVTEERDWCGEWQPAGEAPRIDVDRLSVDLLGLNARARNGLDSFEPPIETIGQLRKMTAAKLSESRNFGELTLRHVRQQLAKNGLALMGERVVLEADQPPPGKNS